MGCLPRCSRSFGPVSTFVVARVSIDREGKGVRLLVLCGLLRLIGLCMCGGPADDSIYVLYALAIG
jgi:hypothetical protein